MYTRVYVRYIQSCTPIHTIRLMPVCRCTHAHVQTPAPSCMHCTRACVSVRVRMCARAGSSSRVKHSLRILEIRVCQLQHRQQPVQAYPIHTYVRARHRHAPPTTSVLCVSPSQPPLWSRRMHHTPLHIPCLPHSRLRPCPAAAPPPLCGPPRWRQSRPSRHSARSARRDA